MTERMTLEEFNRQFEIDRKSSGVKAVPKSKTAQKSHKYKAEATDRIIDGATVKFPSKREAKTYDKLALMERAGAITDLKINAALRGEEKLRYVFQTEPFKFSYEPDFEYIDRQTGEKIVADSKGMVTTTYAKKKKLMKKMFDIDILEY